MDRKNLDATMNSYIIQQDINSYVAKNNKCKINNMTYKQALNKLLELKDSFYKLTWDDSLTEDIRKELREKVPILYGEIEEVYVKIAGLKNVEVEGMGRSGTKGVFPTYLEASILSSSTSSKSPGYQELLKVIGKVQQLAKDPVPLQIEHSVTNLVQILRRFRECCQYIKEPPKNEKAVQDIIWIMLRSLFDRLDREDTLPKFGIKNYIPDFGIPDLQVLVEAKFIGEKTDVKVIQEEIMADIPAYLNASPKYKSIVVFIYDYAQKLRDSRKFEEDLKSIDGIVDVIIIPGIGT